MEVLYYFHRLPSPFRKGKHEAGRFPYVYFEMWCLEKLSAVVLLRSVGREVGEEKCKYC